MVYHGISPPVVFRKPAMVIFQVSVESGAVLGATAPLDFGTSKGLETKAKSL